MANFEKCKDCYYYNNPEQKCTFDCLECKHWSIDFFDFPCSRCRSINIEDQSKKCMVELTKENDNG